MDKLLPPHPPVLLEYQFLEGVNHVLYIFVFSPEPGTSFLSELAIKGIADACFPETGRTRGLGQVLAVRDQMSRIIEQLVSGKVRVDARHMFLHVQGGRGVYHVKQVRIWSGVIPGRTFGDLDRKQALCI